MILFGEVVCILGQSFLRSIAEKCRNAAALFLAPQIFAYTRRKVSFGNLCVFPVEKSLTFSSLLLFPLSLGIICYALEVVFQHALTRSCRYNTPLHEQNEQSVYLQTLAPKNSNKAACYHRHIFDFLILEKMPLKKMKNVAIEV